MGCNAVYLRNQFCATGIGGGVDPSCSPNDANAARKSHRWGLTAKAKDLSELANTKPQTIEKHEAALLAHKEAYQVHKREIPHEGTYFEHEKMFNRHVDSIKRLGGTPSTFTPREILPPKKWVKKK